MKAVVAAFNQEKALVGAFSVITNLRMELFEALRDTHLQLVSSLLSAGGVVGGRGDPVVRGPVLVPVPAEHTLNDLVTAAALRATRGPCRGRRPSRWPPPPSRA